MLELQALSKHFGAKQAVRDVTVAIGAGEFVGVIGRSGAGKSTLLRMINRLVDPSSGRIAFAGAEVTGLRGAALRQWRARCAMIFQQFNLVKRLDVITNVLIGRLAYRWVLPSLLKSFTPAERALAVRALDRIDIADIALQRADTLSGGQQQRVAIARALVQQPRLMLADEPIASLDPRSATMVMETLARINRDEGIAVIVNLHDLATARFYCRRIIGMGEGRVVFDGPPAALGPGVVDRIYGTDEDRDEGGAPPVPLRAVAGR